MTTCKTTLKAWLLFTALLCLAAFAVCLSARAESAGAGASDPIPGTSELGKLDPGGVETSFNIPAPPQFIPGTPPPPNTDRHKSQVAAKAMGLAAASQQKIACMMMMSEAMKEENKKNSGMMMAMAMQMCAQADQTMASAMKNDEGIKQISSADIPKMAELKTSNATFGKDKVKEAEIPKITFNDEVAKTTNMEPDIPVASPPAVPNFAGEPVFNKPSTTDDLKDPITQFTKDTTTLDPIEKPADGKTDDSQKAVSPSLQNGTGGLGGAVAGLPAKSAGGKDDSPVIDEKENTASKRKIGSVVTAGVGPGEGGGGEKSGSTFDMAALMEQMMGGPPAEGPGGIGMELIELGSSKEDPPPNLFEYASYRYHKLQTDKGAIRKGKAKAVKAPHRTLASAATASKVWTASAQKIDTHRKTSE